MSRSYRVAADVIDVGQRKNWQHQIWEDAGALVEFVIVLTVETVCTQLSKDCAIALAFRCRPRTA